MIRFLTTTSVLVFFLILPLATLFSQQQLSGEVRDKQNKRPLEYAHVFFLSQQNTGAITNQLGQFSLEIPERLRSDTLVISLLGYHHYYLPLQNIPQYPATYSLELTPSQIMLGEAVVMAEAGLKAIIRRTIDHLPENYPNENHRLKAYYQEYSIVDSAYTHLMESFITIQDKGYAKKRKTPTGGFDIFIHEFRKSNDERSLKLPPHILNSKGNLMLRGYEIGDLIAGRIFIVGELSERFIENNSFRYLGEDLLGADTLIHIGFTNLRSRLIRPDSTFHYPFIGEFVINKRDYAIVKFRHMINDSDSFWEVQYRKTEGKYYPSLIWSNFTITLQQRTLPFTTARSYHIYQVEPHKKQFTPLGPHKKVLPEQSLQDMNFVYHPEFWKNNAILLQVPANAALEMALSRKQSLAEQFEENARRVVEKQ